MDVNNQSKRYAEKVDKHECKRKEHADEGVHLAALFLLTFLIIDHMIIYIRYDL